MKFVFSEIFQIHTTAVWNMTQLRFSLRTFSRSPPSYDAASSFRPQPAPPHFVDPLTFL